MGPQDNVQQLPEQVQEVIPKEQTQRHLQELQELLRRSTRERRRAILDDYVVFLQEHEDNSGLMKDDPINFLQDMNSSDSQKWIDAMKEEFKSMQDNQVWDLVLLSEGKRPIGCK